MKKKEIKNMLLEKSFSEAAEIIESEFNEAIQIRIAVGLFMFSIGTFAGAIVMYFTQK